MEYKIGVIRGDGIGPEITAEAVKALYAIEERFGHTFTYTDILMGGASIDVHGVPLTDEAVETALAQDAVLMGSIGGDPSTSPWYRLPGDKRPEAGLLRLRRELNVFANLRPAVLYPELKDACPLKAATSARGFDLIILRELTGGIYFGAHSTIERDGVRFATDTLTYSEPEIERIAKRAFEIAGMRRGKVMSVDKANVLDSSKLWRETVDLVHRDYPDIELNHMFVDNCAMQLVEDQAQFDVVLTENMFGDILSDEAAMITGSLGMLPSASLNDTSFGLYEPAGGSAPDIAGKDVANPLATVLSAAMLLRYSLNLTEEADVVEAAVRKVLSKGYRTADLILPGEDKKDTVKCSEMGDLVKKEILA